MPAKIVARRTEMNVKNAETVASFARVLKVLGREQTNEMRAMIAEKPIVQTLWLVMVFRYLAPTRQWKPWMKVLFRTNMTAVKYHAHFEFQKSICPMSHASLTSGCRRQNSLTNR